MKPAIHLIAVVLLLSAIPNSSFSQSTIISYGSTWKYLDTDTRPASWETSGFNDAAWPSGAGQLGYGDGDEITCVKYGENYGTCPVNPACNPTPGGCNNKFMTTYFRKTVNIANPALFSTFTLNVRRDDGIVVYINGTERYSNNMPAGRTHATPASAAAADDGNTPQTTSLSSAFFSIGNNVIAVEVHQNAVTSSDLTFDLELIGNDLFSSGLTRGPYLQMGAQTSLNIRWETTAAENTRVEIGTSYGTYPTVFSNASNVTVHEIAITGLLPDTKYWYRIGNSTNMGFADPTKFFTTLPPANTTRKLRFAVFGDCGRNDNSFQTGSLTQYQRYLTDNSIDAPDALLLLGDNAYTNGTQTEYTNNFFNAYSNNILKSHKLYPTPGNHDYDNGGQPASRTLPYYLNFTMPTAGELGGVASGTEAFYSFDIGDVHFLSLDSYGTEAGSTKLYDTAGTQVTWIKADLAATTKKWVIAYWHHPPYTKGSHDSDGEGDLIAIRENFIRILERNGVDMILCGHSHDYERSYLLKGYYKTNPGDPALSGVNFNVGTHAVNSSSGKYNGTANSCVYTTVSGKNLHGTVYVLSGSSGADGSVVTAGSDTWPHNAMPNSIDEGGMFYFEVDNNRLDAKFINRVAGPGGIATIGDQFTIMKDVNISSTLNVVNGSSINLTASWPQSTGYTWTSTPGTTRTVNVTPPNSTTTIYTVADGLGCVADQFSVTATGTLPVSLLSFDAKLVNGKVNVNWTTVTETNNKLFTVERSDNAIDFTAIGTVNGAINSTSARSYLFTDPLPLTGTSYYRLSQTNIDDRKEYLGVRQIKNYGKDFDVKAITAGGGLLSLEISAAAQGVYQLRVYDMQGREFRNEMINCSAGVCKKTMVLTAGVYIYEVVSSKGEKLLQKVLVK